MDIKEAYRVMQAECGIEVGDKVKILRPNSSGEYGSDSPYHTQTELDNYGTEGTVTHLGQGYISVSAQKGYDMPFFVLKVIKKNKPEKMVDVDGKQISVSTIKQALQDLWK